MNISPEMRSNLRNVFIPFLLINLSVIGLTYLYTLFQKTNIVEEFNRKIEEHDHNLIDRNKLVTTTKMVIPHYITAMKNILPFKHSRQKEMFLVMVSCGNRRNETSTVVKSAVSLSYRNLIIIIFTDKENMIYYSSLKAQWSGYIQRRVKLDIREAVYPANIDEKKWRPLFRPCSSLRLFMPTILQDVDSILYLDLDVLLMHPVDTFWNIFNAMNSSQMVALVPEHLDLATGWYNRFARHPFYGRLGLNSGVMLMNLTRLRKFSWDEYPDPILKQYRKDLTWGDQDIINIILHSHPDKVYVMGCEHNFRPDYCVHVNTCKTAETLGILAVHGSRLAFTGNKFPAFKSIYKAWNEYNYDGNLRQDLYYPMQRYLMENVRTNCGKLHEGFLKRLKEIADPF